MSIETKTCIQVNPPLAPITLSALTASEITDEKIKQLMEENRLLREEIKALKTIIKNTNN